MEKSLALKMQPNSIKEIIGQTHLVGKDKIIYNLVKNKKMFSMIFYGPPGVGKTSLALAIVKDLDIRYRLFNATIDSKKDLDIIIEEAKLYNGIVVIIDEIHRLNKDKQDILLPLIESNLITIIGLTTSNPYYKINPAIRSRCHIFELGELTKDDIVKGLKKAIKYEDISDIKITNKELNYISELASNDLRYAYNLLELAYYSSNDHKVNIDLLKGINNKKVFISDSNENGHYNLLSAFQKSIRGSDVDASLHYLGRLIKIGDLDSIYRRMSVIAYEDIGLANPNIGPIVNAAINLSELVGLPEARIILSNVIIQMALSPKSNSSIIAIDKALEDIETNRCGDIPDTIKIYSSIYKYPHNFPNHFVKQQYLPDNLLKRKYYIPQDSSQNERILKQIYEKIEKLKGDN